MEQLPEWGVQAGFREKVPGLEVERLGGDDHTKTFHQRKEEVQRLSIVQPLYMGLEGPRSGQQQSRVCEAEW